MERARRPVSILLTVVAAAAAQGGVVGRAEVVDTGEVVTLASAADLGALLQRLADPDLPP